LINIYCSSFSVTIFKPPLNKLLPIDWIYGMLSTELGVAQFIGGTKNKF
jgi:hypothetical protein